MEVYNRVKKINICKKKPLDNNTDRNARAIIMQNKNKNENIPWMYPVAPIKESTLLVNTTKMGHNNDYISK